MKQSIFLLFNRMFRPKQAGTSQPNLVRMRNTLSALFILLFLWAGTPPAKAQSHPPFLSENAGFYLITCGPGNDFYTTFGHTALLVKGIVLTDTVDMVFNYGTFDFNTPHFYYNFAKGRLNYCLSISEYRYFLEEYREEGRSVRLQRLNLSSSEQELLFGKLLDNYQPAHRYYAYDLLRDNCATRIRDLLWNLDSNPYRTEPSPQAKAYRTKSSSKAKTYRQLLHPYMQDKLEWWKLGVDLVLGIPCDRPCSPEDCLFLPMELERATGSSCEEVLQESKEELADSFPPLPCMLLVLLFFVVISLLERQGKISKVAQVADRLLFGVTALVSIVLLFLWFCSDHYCSQWNLNILWINPLFLISLFCGKKRGLIPLKIIRVCLLASLVIYFFRWPQCFPWAALPLLLTLLLRTQRNIQKRSSLSRMKTDSGAVAPKGTFKKVIVEQDEN